MLIKVLSGGNGEISHRLGKFAVVQGYADVPQEVATELVKFKSLYAPLREPVPQAVLDALHPQEEQKDKGKKK